MTSLTKKAIKSIQEFLKTYFDECIDVCLILKFENLGSICDVHYVDNDKVVTIKSDGTQVSKFDSLDKFDRYLRYKIDDALVIDTTNDILEDIDEYYFPLKNNTIWFESCGVVYSEFIMYYIIANYTAGDSIEKLRSMKIPILEYKNQDLIVSKFKKLHDAIKYLNEQIKLEDKFENQENNIEKTNALVSIQKQIRHVRSFAREYFDIYLGTHKIIDTHKTIRYAKLGELCRIDWIKDDKIITINNDGTQNVKHYKFRSFEEYGCCTMLKGLVIDITNNHIEDIDEDIIELRNNSILLELYTCSDIDNIKYIMYYIIAHNLLNGKNDIESLRSIRIPIISYDDQELLVCKFKKIYKVFTYLTKQIK